MNKTIFCTAILLCMLFVPAYCQKDDVFGDSIVEAYDKAFELNESKDYLQAYRQIVQTASAVDRVMSVKQVKVSELSDREFLYIYWQVKKSKAEIAYMLGLHTDMKVVSDELRAALDKRHWENEDGETVRGIVGGLRADIAKIEGCRYYLVERYDSSEVALLNALRFSPRYGNDAFINKVHDDLALLYYKREAYDMALAHLDSILASPLYSDIAYRNKETKQNIMLVKSQRALCLAQMGRYDEALAIIDPIVLEYKRLQYKRLYAEALRKKAKILMLEYDATGKYKPLAKSCYQEYLAVSKDYIDEQFVRMNESEREQYWMAEQPFVTDCFRLEDKAPDLLYDVALYSKAVLLQMGRDFQDDMTVSERQSVLSDIRVTWQQIKDQLPQNGCAIEFIIYDKAGKKHIGALVINKESKAPLFVDISDVESIGNHQVIKDCMVKDILADTNKKENINRLYNDSTLRHLIWNDNLIKAIEDCSDVFFSPDGIFHQIGIEYLVPQTIADRQFYRLTTTRMLVQKREKIKTEKMMLCGGVDYFSSMDDKDTGNDELAYSLLSATGVRVQNLPNSAVEVDSIAAIRRCHLEDMVLRADSVTEKALNELLGKYNIFHISTHGLFNEVSKMGTDIHPSAADMQLSNSLLYLSGSERNLQQKDYDASCHDGILSARELAKMNLVNVDLTVMSACMSGLGYITPDGVYGLQRGLKTAGVKAIISTLWSVDDKASCLFTTQLYNNLESGQGLHEAFWNARNFLRKYEQSYGSSSAQSAGTSSSSAQKKRFTFNIYNKPYFYNAFILIDCME